VCRKGYYDNAGSVCVMCEVGTYKDFQGPGTCLLCAEGTYSSTLGLNASSGCNDCPVGTTSGSGSTDVSDCSCGAAGYYMPSGNQGGEALRSRTVRRDKNIGMEKEIAKLTLENALLTRRVVVLENAMKLSETV